MRKNEFDRIKMCIFNKHIFFNLIFFNLAANVFFSETLFPGIKRLLLFQLATFSYKRSLINMKPKIYVNIGSALKYVCTLFCLPDVLNAV